MPTVEERVDSLESLLGQFIVHTDVSLRRLENEMREFKEEMRAFREESERDRKALHEEMKAFKEESEKDRQALHEEMKAFKEESEKDRKALHEEMKAFKEESEKDRKALHEEMKAFKEESEKDRKALHEEMREFKEEMRAFKEEMKEENRRKNREWSNLAKKMGTIVEDLIAPALRPVLSRYFNCEVSMEGQRMFRRRNGEDYEIDAIAVCDDRVFMVEARSTPRFDDIKEIKEKSERFFEFFPEHKGKELVVIFGSITFPENVIRQASRHRIYVLAWREWEYMDILNFEEVSPQSSRATEQ